MADLSKLRRRGTLGAPPAPEDASTNLKAPETAPIATLRRVDGRSLRRTGRTLQFATRVTEDFDERLHKIAERDGLLLVEVLEQGLAAYENTRNSSS